MQLSIILFVLVTVIGLKCTHTTMCVSIVFLEYVLRSPKLISMVEISKARIIMIIEVRRTRDSLRRNNSSNSDIILADRDSSNDISHDYNIETHNNIPWLSVLYLELQQMCKHLLMNSRVWFSKNQSNHRARKQMKIVKTNQHTIIVIIQASWSTVSQFKEHINFKSIIKYISRIWQIHNEQAHNVC